MSNPRSVVEERAPRVTKKAQQAADDLALLRQISEGGSYGRGRIIGSTARLLKAGLIRRYATGYYDWSVSITPAGRAVLSGKVAA